MAVECFTVADDEVVCFDGERVLRSAGLAPEREVKLGGLEMTTLTRPSGARLATVATVNDCHFGETRCGLIEGADIGPVLSTEPGGRPYPEVMNSAAASEISAAQPDAVVAKGDLTSTGDPAEYEAFESCYRPLLGSRLITTRGNHDQPAHGPAFGSPPNQEIHLPGVALAVLDTSRSGLIGGRLDRGQLEWLDELAARCATPVLVFGHHPVSVVGDPVLTPTWALDHPSSDGLLEVVGRRRNVCGYFAGHSHRNAVNRFPATGAVPFAEVAAVKDFPGTWAEYRIFEGGILAVHRRISSDREAVSWSERCRDLYAGGYPAYALGALADRCYTVWSATSTS